MWWILSKSKDQNRPEKTDWALSLSHWELGYQSSLECLLADIGTEVISPQFRSWIKYSFWIQLKLHAKLEHFDTEKTEKKSSIYLFFFRFSVSIPSIKRIKGGYFPAIWWLCFDNLNNTIFRKKLSSIFLVYFVFFPAKLYLFGERVPFISSKCCEWSLIISTTLVFEEFFDFCVCMVVCFVDIQRLILHKNCLYSSHFSILFR